MNNRRKNNPIAKQLSDPLWKMRVVKSKMVYTRKSKHKKEQDNCTSLPRQTPMY